MDTTSVWRGTAPSTGYPALQGDISTDVLVIGGGITGVTLAWLLAQQGREVVLLEAGEIGGGTSGHSTGNLYETVAQGMREVQSRWGDEVVLEVVLERRAAMDFIEERCRHLPDVGWRRCPLVLWSDGTQDEAVRREREVLAGAGCALERAAAVPSPLPPARGEVLVLKNQAQFQPQAYLVALAAAAAEAGARIHEHSKVVALEASARRALTASATVTAREIVMATHSPKGIHLVHAEMPVHREYAIAMAWDAAAAPGPGIFWWQGRESLSVRTLESGGRHYLVCAGQEHKVGIHNAKAGLLALETLARQHFGDRPITHRWSAQNYRGADALPYIGRDANGCFVATGFATDGLTWGTVAARLVAAELLGHPAVFAERVRPNRLSPLKGAKHIVEENVLVARQLARDYLTGGPAEKLTALAPGDSAILEAEGETFAAYRAPDGELFAVSNVCTHMGCKVHWNSVETSWDCPCHGSRFAPDGSVIEGPALVPLQRRQIMLATAAPGAPDAPAGAG